MFAQQIEEKNITIIGITGEIIPGKDYGKITKLFCNRDIVYESELVCIYSGTLYCNQEDYYYFGNNNIPSTDENKILNSIDALYFVNVKINNIKYIPHNSVINGMYGHMFPKQIPRNIFKHYKTITFENKYIIYRDLYYYCLCIKLISSQHIIENYDLVIKLYNNDIPIIIELIKCYCRSNLFQSINKKNEDIIIENILFFDKVKKDIDPSIHDYFEDLSFSNFQARLEKDKNNIIGDILCNIYDISIYEQYGSIINEYKKILDYDTCKSLILETYKFDFNIFYCVEDIDIAKYLLSIQDNVKIYNINPKLIVDNEILILAISNHSLSLQHIPQNYHTREMIIEAFKNDYKDIKYASTLFSDDIDFLYKVIDISGQFLKYASPRLRDNKDLVLKAIEFSNYNVIYASERLNNDHDIIRKINDFKRRENIYNVY